MTTLRLTITGYGGETYAGKVDRKIYDYFKQNQYDIEEYANGDDDWDELVPDDLKPFQYGEPSECDNIFHEAGATLDGLTLITVSDLNDNIIWQHGADVEVLKKLNVSIVETSAVYFSDLPENTVIFSGGNGEKGCFFDAEFETTDDFDPTKLVIKYDNCNNWKLITCIEYDGDELEGLDGYDTRGKWCENNWHINGDEEIYESISIDDRD